MVGKGKIVKGLQTIFIEQAIRVNLEGAKSKYDNCHTDSTQVIVLK
jgi:hypothetical protein